MWQDTPVLVTGATGFIGGHLAQRLAAQGARVTGSGRNLAAGAWLAPAGVNLQPADLRDEAALAALVAGQAVVFHAAAWLGTRHGEKSQAWPLNVDAPLALVRAAAQAGVQRLVLVSSITAYGPPRGPVMDETRPVDTSQAAIYGRTKAEGEQAALALAAGLGLPLAVARPGMVYGPRSYGWSVRMVRLLQRRVPVIFGDGQGHAHPVYIDNLVDGLLLAATRPEAAGQAFNFVDAPLTWQAWFDYYAAMAGTRPGRVPLWLARGLIAVGTRLPLGFALDGDLLAYYTARTVYPSDKAARWLGYRPGVAIDEGMRRTEAWLRGEEYL